jgi:hypothetical protein
MKNTGDVAILQNLLPVVRDFLSELFTKSWETAEIVVRHSPEI